MLAALAFQGSRGLWEPDEGFYTGPALDMARGGDLLIPHLNGNIFIDKPPLSYWAMAASVSVFGINEWGFRLPAAFFYLATALLAGAIAGQLRGMEYRYAGTLAYGLMLAPLLASNVLTPDTPLVFFCAGSLYAYVRSLRETVYAQAARWQLLAGVCFGLAALTKGPAAILFMAPLPLHAIWTNGIREGIKTSFRIGLPAFGIAAAWYATVLVNVPGAAAYLWDNQVWGRLASRAYGRNGGGIEGALKVYLPMLLVGTFPLPLLMFDRFRTARSRSVRQWTMTSDNRLLLLSTLLPLSVLAMAQSRLPLYALPLFPTVAVIFSRPLHRYITDCGRLYGGQPLRIRSFAALGWILFLVVLKMTAAWLPPAHAARKDTRAVATMLKNAGVLPESPVIVIDSKRNALPAYGYKQLIWARDLSRPYPVFKPPIELTRVLASLGRRLPYQVAFVADEGYDFSKLIQSDALRPCKQKTYRGVLTFECREDP